MSGSKMFPGLGRAYEETKRVSRILELIQLITAKPRNYRRRDLAARFEISERMVQKDLDVIRNGLKLDLGRSPEGYHFQDLPRLPAVGFSFSEALSLLMVVQAGRLNTGIDTAELDAALARLRGLFPLEFGRHLRNLAKDGSPSESPGGKHRRKIMRLIQDALLLQRKVRILYSTNSRGGEVNQRVVHPYRIVSYVRSWHLIAHCEWREKVLTFKIDRIRTAEALNESFVMPSDFCLETHLGTGWGMIGGQECEAVDIELLFEPEAGRRVLEEQWHKSQKAEVQPSGYVSFYLHLPVTPDFVSWILYYGSRVEVLGPIELRNRVVEEHRKAADRYGSDGENDEGRR